MKDRYKMCRHALSAMDDIVIVDLDCKHYGLCHGTAIVTKMTCKYCECLERGDGEKNRNQKYKSNLG